MLDYRDPDVVLLELREARQRFEKQAPVPIAARDLLFELADQLADSGPLELGVSPRRWARTQTRVNEFVAALRGDPTSPQSTTWA